MRKYFLLAALFIAFCFRGLSQYTENRRMDSIRIDSLRKIMPGLKGEKKVDVLNKLSELIGGFAPGGSFAPGGDSMYHYALEANKEATRLDYEYGLAHSLLNLSKALRTMRRPDQPMDPSRKKYLLQAIQIGKELHNDSILGSAYYLLAGIEERKTNYKKAIVHFQKTGDLQNETEVTTWLCMESQRNGQYEEGFPYCEKCIELARKNVASNKNDWAQELVQWSLYDMAELYKAAGDYETTLDYYKQFNQYAEDNHLPWTESIDKVKAELCLLMDQFDSALYYWQNWEKKRGSNSETDSPGRQALDNTSLGLIYLKTNKADKALPLFMASIKTFNEMGKKESGYAMIKPLIYTSEFHILKNDFAKALNYIKEAFALSQEGNVRPSIMDCYELFSNIYHQLGKKDSAYLYLLKYTKLKDSIFTRQFLWRLNNYKKLAEDVKKEARLGFLDRDNKIKEEQLNQEAQLKKFLIIGMLLLLMIGIFIFRTLSLKRKNEKLANEKKHSELQQKFSALEMQALRAQMNPHFIFNCLSSINRFILKNEPDTASDYLTRFSRLIRMVLMNSQKSLITLEDELEMLTIYLDMERLRFKNNFDYHIVFTNRVEPGAIFIPPLLLQPFCENAIWHGLKHLADPQSGRHEHGRLDIELSMADKVLNCIITDNGIGRQRAAEIKSKSAEEKKSFGLKITTERLALLNGEKGPHTFYEIEDLKDESGNAVGTKVVLKITYRESVEEIA